MVETRMLCQSGQDILGVAQLALKLNILPAFLIANAGLATADLVGDHHRAIG